MSAKLFTVLVALSTAVPASAQTTGGPGQPADTAAPTPPSVAPVLNLPAQLGPTLPATNLLIVGGVLTVVGVLAGGGSSGGTTSTTSTD